MTENFNPFEPDLSGILKAPQKESPNFRKIAATLSNYGFDCIQLADDSEEADFLAYHLSGTITLKVQLKSRVTIEKRCCGREIWVVFPHEGLWYLIHHDRLVEKIGQHTAWLSTAGWKEKGSYSSARIDPDLLESLAENRLGPVYGPAALDRNVARSAPARMPRD